MAWNGRSGKNNFSWGIQSEFFSSIWCITFQMRRIPDLFLVSAEGRKLMKRICVCVSLSVYENYYENLTLCFFATIYDLSSENDYVWEKPDT